VEYERWQTIFCRRSAARPEQSGKLRGVVTTEVCEEPLVVVEPQELPDQLDGDDLAVCQQWRRASAAEAAGEQILQQVVYQDEHTQDKVGQWHGGSSAV
jgi:hypothetical protein